GGELDELAGRKRPRRGKPENLPAVEGQRSHSAFWDHEILKRPAEERHANRVVIAFVGLQPREEDRREQLNELVVDDFEQASGLWRETFPDQLNERGWEYVGGHDGSGCCPESCAPGAAATSVSAGTAGPSSGSATWNAVTPSGALSAQIRPAWASTRPLAIYRPRPSPLVLPACAARDRAYRSKTNGRSSAGMPGPRFVTTISAVPPLCVTSRPISVSGEPYLTAFDSRFATICSSRCASALTNRRTSDGIRTLVRDAASDARSTMSSIRWPRSSRSSVTRSRRVSSSDASIKSFAIRLKLSAADRICRMSSRCAAPTAVRRRSALLSEMTLIGWRRSCATIDAHSSRSCSSCFSAVMS